MKFLVNIDKVAAIRQGKNAPDSTAQIELDPATLTQDERNLLAERTKGDGYKVSGLSIAEPTEAAFRAELANTVACHKKQVEQQQRERHETALRCMQPATRTKMVGLDRAGQLSSRARAVETEITWVGIRDENWSWAEAFSADDQAAYAAAQERHNRAEQAAIEAALPGLRDQLASVLAREAEERAQAEERAARTKAEFDALYNKLPEPFRKRHAAGYASEAELAEAICSMIITEAGYLESIDWDYGKKLTTLTDSEFSRLQAIRAEAPKHAIVTAKEIGAYQIVEGEDGDEQVCKAIARVAVISLSQAGYEAETALALNPEDQPKLNK